MSSTSKPKVDTASPSRQSWKAEVEDCLAAAAEYSQQAVEADPAHVQMTTNAQMSIAHSLRAIALLLQKEVNKEGSVHQPIQRDY